MKTADLHISPALPEDFPVIQAAIQEMELDDRDLQVSQFLVARSDKDLLGFGRIRRHRDCDEYCSLGVLPQYRSQAVAKAITHAIIRVSTQPLYLVCILPAYFEPLGFQIVDRFPAAMQGKLDYCNEALAVPEPYVVMRFVSN